MKAKAGVPTERTDVLWTRPVEDQPAIGIDKMHAGRDAGVRQDPVSEPERLENPHHLVVEMHGARKPVDVGVALQHDNRKAAIGGEIRQRGADGTIAHHADVRIEAPGIQHGMPFYRYVIVN